MYRDGIGLTVLGGFENHDGYDGVMLGFPDGLYHLEFTRQHGHVAPHAPTAEHLLVLYEPDSERWNAACERMISAGFRAVPAHNPYWDRRGLTFEDLEGYRVVWQHSSWPIAAAVAT